MELTVTNRVRAWPKRWESGQGAAGMNRSKLACGEAFMMITEYLRSKWHWVTKSRSDPRGVHQSILATQEVNSQGNVNMYVVLKVQNLYSSLAQSVEHAAVNRSVVGSSPTGGAFGTWSPICKSYTRLHGQAVKTPPFHGGNRGSNPLGVIIQKFYIICKI